MRFDSFETFFPSLWKGSKRDFDWRESSRPREREFSLREEKAERKERNVFFPKKNVWERLKNGTVHLFPVSIQFNFDSIQFNFDSIQSLDIRLNGIAAKFLDHC